jgi:hypothetical protein
MAKSLVIVESPTKVKTLKGFLGADFQIMGSKGHVRDLPKSGLAVDIEHDFKSNYQLLPDRKTRFISLPTLTAKARQSRGTSARRSISKTSSASSSTRLPKPPCSAPCKTRAK